MGSHLDQLKRFLAAEKDQSGGYAQYLKGAIAREERRVSGLLVCPDCGERTLTRQQKARGYHCDNCTAILES